MAPGAGVMWVRSAASRRGTHWALGPNRRSAPEEFGQVELGATAIDTRSQLWRGDGVGTCCPARAATFAGDRRWTWSEAAQPGFDLHTWESTWASIEEDAAGDPDAALSQYAELVQRILAASGYALDDPVARQGEEVEIVRTYLAARETAERAELGAASRSDVEQAIDDLRAVFVSLASAARTA